jgi:uncharacterized protein (TIGR03435 family)
MVDLPRAYGVHITPTSKKALESADTGTDEYWALQGFKLRAALARVFSEPDAPFPESRIDLPASLDPDERYDFLLVYTPTDRHQDSNRLMQRGIERHFHVSLVFEQRPTDVYVLSAPAGQTAAIRSADQGGDDVGVGFASSYMSITSFASEMPEPQSMAARIPPPEALRRATRGSAVGRLTITNETMETFCFELEQVLDRPVVDETGLSGRYDIELPEQTGRASIATRLKDELGLTLTEDRRDVRVLVAKSQ